MKLVFCLPIVSSVAEPDFLMSVSIPTRVRQRSLATSPASVSRVSATTGASVLPRDISITHQPIGDIQPLDRPVRRRGKGQVERLASNIERFGCCVAILVTASGGIIDGHAIYEACRRLEYATVPTIVIDHLTGDEVRALRLSLNRIAENSTWDPEALACEFAHLLAVEPDLVAFTGFDLPEIDLALTSSCIDGTDPADALPQVPVSAVSRLGDIWDFAGGHRLLCGNARAGESYAAVLAGQGVQKVATDPPYGCYIRDYVSGRHGEFVEGSGMGEAEATVFFESFLGAMVPHLEDGAIVEMFIDARGMLPLLTAARGTGLTQLTTCVWDKGVGGMGSLYRQQTEFVLVMKHGRGRHINNIALGRHGRNRTTIWSAPGLNGFGRGREEALALHPTVKPVGLIADAMLDTSHRGGLILDPFCGSGTTLLAAHRTGRIGYGIELDPVYVDVAVRRMEALTGALARHADTGLTFAEQAERRSYETSALPPAAADA
ncbi:site-specific DNA-methyltransferase [Methylobacterium pseudosasicola]|uniref:Methyltransferase n=1 Tax=Methylobacterium pseudosasicola TaxID=582667 RepID=A0A1I4TG92_9HYPH|nr:DNA methyltransferase [Methylobacterium pseudosasicola]SFM75577.1 DNA modification methylase [Methylobacterium pseudosasicola]